MKWYTWCVCDSVCFAHGVTCIVHVCVVTGFWFCMCLGGTRVHVYSAVTVLCVHGALV